MRLPRQLSREQVRALEEEVGRAGIEFSAANVRAGLQSKLSGSKLDPNDMPASLAGLREMRDAIADLSAKAEAFALAIDNIVRALDPPGAA